MTRARRHQAALGAAAAAALVVGFAVGAGAGGDGGSSREQGTRTHAAVDQLSLRQQVGELLIVSFPGQAAPDYVRRRLRTGEGAGVVLFGENAASAAQLRRLTDGIQSSAHRAALVAVDQEGGDLRSISFAGPAQAPPGMGTPAQVGRAYRAAGRELSALGVNVDLAPVADVPGPGSVVAARSFSGPPGAVPGFAAAAVRGLAAAGVGAVPKHFPGFGSARQNTDDAGVSIHSPADLLRRRDLPPFAAAVRAGAPLVMVSHALYPAIDGGRIASQSPSVIGGLLRRELGFRGAVITDSLEAQAVLRRSSIQLAAQRAIAAGCDLLLLTGSASAKLVYPPLLRAARRSPRFRARVRQAAARVLELKRRLGLRSPRTRARRPPP
jgi:beta-N-acetylhexosaminidase